MHSKVFHLLLGLNIRHEKVRSTSKVHGRVAPEFQISTYRRSVFDFSYAYHEPSVSVEQYLNPFIVELNITGLEMGWIQFIMDVLSNLHALGLVKCLTTLNTLLNHITIAVNYLQLVDFEGSFGTFAFLAIHSRPYCIVFATWVRFPDFEYRE
jgi:hypothetical protein